MIQDIAAHIRDNKIAWETIVDTQGKTALKHAIKNNDAQFVQTHAQALLDEQRQRMIRYAAQCERPQVVLALLSEGSAVKAHAETSQYNRQRTYVRVKRKPLMQKTPESILKRHIYAIPDLTLPEYTAYQHALTLRREERMQNAWELLEHVPAQTHFSIELAVIIAQMLHPTIKLRKNKDQATIAPFIHPELENDIISGNDKHFDELVTAGWLADNGNNDGLDALSLAVYHGQLTIIKKLIGQIPFVSEQHRNTLKKMAEDRADYYNKRLSYDQEAQEKFQKYRAIAQFIDADWLDTEKNNALIIAFNENNVGAFLQALERGANPNFQDENNKPLVWHALKKDPIFLKILVDTKKIDPQTAVVGDRMVTWPLLVWAIVHNKLEHTKILLDAEFDLNAHDGTGDPVVWFTINNDNTDFLQMLLIPKSLISKRAYTLPKAESCPCLYGPSARRNLPMSNFFSMPALTRTLHKNISLPIPKMQKYCKISWQNEQKENISIAAHNSSRSTLKRHPLISASF